VVSLYVPNGQAVGTDKFAYKLNWLRGLRAYLDRHARSDQPLALCGDWNVAPEARDVHEPSLWEGSTLYHPAARTALADVAAFGLVDLLRKHHSETGIFSWWDYRMLAFQRNQGLRIDHLLCTEALASRSLDVTVDREARKGKNASDHAPVIARFG
jgi:exodeoxyribonuclease III